MATNLVTVGGQNVDSKAMQQKWVERIKASQAHRRKFEREWRNALAFAAGKHHLEWSRTQRKLVMPEERKRDRNKYSCDVLTQYRMTAMGELLKDDYLATFKFSRADVESEDFADQVNRGYEKGWEREWFGDKKMAELILQLIDTGNGAIWTYFDRTNGKVEVESVPYKDGQPILDPEEAAKYVGDLAAQGQTAQFGPLLTGEICWEVLGPLNLFPPPGVKKPEKFPWEVIGFPMYIDDLHRNWPAAASVKAEKNLTTAGASEDAESGHEWDGDPIQEHVMVYCAFEKPTKAYPMGSTTILAGAEYQIVDFIPSLPIVPKVGKPSSGITYFGYWPVTNQFWSRGLTAAGVGMVRAYNRRREQIGKIIDKGMPKVYIRDGDYDEDFKGEPLSIHKMSRSAQPPIIDGGVQPGSWMQDDAKDILSDLEQAMGTRAVSLGENPSGVSNYSQLALLKENDMVKLGPVEGGIKIGMAEVAVNTLYLMRRYWGAEKQFLISGPSNMVDAFRFNASKIPDFFLVSVATGAGKPRSQGAQLKMIDDIATYSTNSGQPLPVSWVKESYEKGEPVDLPEDLNLDQRSLAVEENERLMRGEEVQVQAYHNAMVHIPEHRSLQIQAEVVGRQDIWDAVEAHIQMHLEAERAQAEQQAMQQMPAPAAPAPPQGQDSMPYPHVSAFSLFNRRQ